jgi:hypothetical protein
MKLKSARGFKGRLRAGRDRRRNRLAEGTKVRTVYVGSHEDKLSRLSAVHIAPDDDRSTREDRHADRSVFADSVLEPVDMPRWLRGRRRARRDKFSDMDQ